MPLASIRRFVMDSNLFEVKLSVVSTGGYTKADVRELEISASAVKANHVSSSPMEAVIVRYPLLE